MHPRLTLLHKALILVAIPLVFELFFISQLAQVLQEAEAEAGKQAWAYEVTRESNSLSVALLGIVRTLSSPWTEKQHRPSHEDYQHSRAMISDSMQHLVELSKVATQPGFAADIANLDAVIVRLFSVLDPIEDKLERNIRVSNQETLPLVMLCPELQRRAQAFGGLAMRLREQTEVNRESASRRMRNWLIAGVSFNVLLALGLTFAFNRNATIRLRRVVENSRRLASGQDLLPVIAGGDEIAHLDVTFHDMAAALAQARASEQSRTDEIAHILKNMPVGLVIADGEGRLLQCNEEFERMVQRNQAELAGWDLTNFVTVNGQAALGFDTITASDGTTEIDLVAADGSKTASAISASVIGSSERKRYLLAFPDMTQKREFERSRQSFVAMVTGELRSPLRQMQEFFSDLQDNKHKDLHDQALEHAQLGFASTTRMLRLVSDVLDFESANRGDLVIEKRNANLKSLISRALGETAELARNKQITLTNEGEELAVSVDEDRIVQVLINLVSNAIKFSEPGSTVRIVHAQLSSGMDVEVRVIDTGRGIPVHLQEAIFEKFKQVTDDDSRRGRGTGLGLPICKNIVKKHGGSIKAESQPGQGSTFIVYLPGVVLSGEQFPAAVLSCSDNKRENSV